MQDADKLRIVFFFNHSNLSNDDKVQLLKLTKSKTTGFIGANVLCILVAPPVMVKR